LAFERYPAAYSRDALFYLRLTTRWAERRCPRLLAVSQSTANDLVELHGLTPDRITVVPLGGGEPPPCPRAPDASQERLVQLGIDRPFALHVGGVEARENQVTPLRATHGRADL